MAATNYNLTISGGISTQGTGEGFSGNNSIGDLDVRGNNTSIVGVAGSTIITQTTPTAGSPSNDRVIEVNPDLVSNFNFSISGVTLTGGKTPDGGGAMVSGSAGNVVTVTSCVFSNNQSINGSSPGGAIFNIGGGNLIINSSTFTSNSSNPSSGGAINVANNPATGMLQITKLDIHQ